MFFRSQQIYDSATRQCIISSSNTCGGPTIKCPANGDTTSDSTVCSNYYVCKEENGPWTKQSCPTGQFYDVNDKKCKSRQLATPVSTCDRCEYSTSAWVNAVDPLCEKYFFCKNGVETGKAQCPKGFFNEQLQRCSVGSDLAEYRKDNGACYQAQTTEPPTDPENPGETDPENPGETDPENPGETDPENPGETDPENPGETDPENPGETDPEGTEPEE